MSSIDSDDFTGERVIPNYSDKPGLMANFQEHICRYMFASQFVTDKIVLDVACGTGYGSMELINKGAKSVFGIDNSITAINYSNAHYNNKNLVFQLGDCTKLEFPDSQFDVIVSMETIEHLNQHDQEKFMNESKRLLKENGLMCISTPNKKNYSLAEKNKFHFKEFYEDDFILFLKKYFKHVKIYYQFYPPSMMISDFLDSDEIQEINIPSINQSKENNSSLFFVAICSNADLPVIVNKMYFLSKGNLIEGKLNHLDELRAHIELQEQVIVESSRFRNDIENSITFRILKKFDKIFLRKHDKL